MEKREESTVQTAKQPPTCLVYNDLVFVLVSENVVIFQKCLTAH